MEYDNALACSQGAQSLFYNACKVCGTMNINQSIVGIGELDNPIVGFQCRGCGRSYKMYAYVIIDGLFQGFRNKHAMAVVIEYDGMEGLGVVLSKDTVAILKANAKVQYAPVEKVTMLDTIRKYSGYNPPEVISSAKTMFDFGLSIGLIKCPDCGANLITSRIKKVMHPLSVEEYDCCNCAKTFKRRRYLNFREGESRYYPNVIRCKKLKAQYFGIRAFGGYLVDDGGETTFLEGDTFEFICQRD